MFAKYGINGIWTEDQLKHHKELSEKLNTLGIKPKWFDTLSKIGDGRFNLNHRRMSNNSIAFNRRPQFDFLDLVFDIMRSEGEPGFINLEAANKRRPNAHGLNPCSEILLDSKGLCNLTTLNLVEFIETDHEGKKKLNLTKLEQAQRLSARSGLRMTLVTLELPEWDKVQKRDRLIGTSLTGVKDALDILGYDHNDEKELITMLGNASRDEAIKYAHKLRVQTPLLSTTVKPEGTLSQVFSGVSSGLHLSHSPYYIRRIRINAADPLAKTVKELGWTINPEVGTPGATFEEKMQNARTLVIDFPVASGAKKTKFDTDVKEQLDTYFMYQKYYTDHNSSNTITVRPDEWDTARNTIYDRWDDFVGVSFLQLDGGSYALAPYEACTKEEYEKLKTTMKPFDMKLLIKHENEHEDFTNGKLAGASINVEEDIENNINSSKDEKSSGSDNESLEIAMDPNQESCVGGVCPVR